MKRAIFFSALMALLSVLPCIAATYTVQQDGSGDFTTITAAVSVAASGDSILVGGGVFQEQMIVIDRVLHIVSISGPSLTTVDGQSSAQIFDYLEGGGGTLSGFSLINANSSEGGGAVDINSVGEALEITDCEFRNNVSFYQGGGIAAGSTSIVSVTDCLFQGNYAPTHCGAAVGIQGSQMEFTRCEFRENSCDVFSAALAVHSSLLNVRDCLFIANTSGDVAGAIYYFASMGIVEGNTFVENSSPGRATVVIHQSPSIVVNRNIFAHDTYGFGLQYHECSGQHGCNIFWDNADGPIDPPYLADDELVADPMFCEPEQGIFAIYDVSPAAPEHSACGELIGAFPVACASTATTPCSWGRLKSLY